MTYCRLAQSLNVAHISSTFSAALSFCLRHILDIPCQSAHTNKGLLLLGEILWYDDAAVPWLNGSHSLNTPGFLSSGKILSAKGYEAPRVRSAVKWKCEPLPLSPHNIYCSIRPTRLKINLGFNMFCFLNDRGCNTHCMPLVIIFLSWMAMKY